MTNRHEGLTHRPLANPRPDVIERHSASGDALNNGIDVPSPLILFDGVCNFCSWSVQFLAPRDRDRTLWFAPIQSERGQAVLAGWSIPTADWESFVLIENGQAYFKSEAFFKTVRYMTWPWPVFGAGRILPRRMADWLYDRIARNRYAVFGRKSVCMIPRPDIAARFLR